MTRGLSLIETLVYLGLLSLLLTGCLVSAYALEETAARNQTMARIEQDGTFMVSRLRTLEDPDEHTAAALTSFELSGFSFLRSGAHDDATEPERTDISFTLHALGTDPSLERTFRHTFYANAP